MMHGTSELIVSQNGVANVAAIRETTLSSPEKWFTDWISGGTSNDAGVTLTIETMLGIPAIWNSLSKICGHLAQMPLEPFEWKDRKNNQREVDETHPSYRLLTYAASETTAADYFRETLSLHAIARGNGRAYIHWNERFEPVALEILEPELTLTGVVYDTDTGSKSKWHMYTPPYNGRPIMIPDYRMLHIAGLGYDGIQGYDLLHVARQSLGLAVVSERQQCRYYKNDARPSLLLIAGTDSQLNEEAKARQFIDGFNEYHSGENKGRAGLLRRGMTAMVIPTNGEGQAVESRQFSRQDMALLMCVESMLGDKTQGWQSLEQKQREYRTNCLGKWMTRWKLECWNKLLSSKQQRKQSHTFEWDDSMLLQATFAERMEAYSKGISSLILAPNEPRGWEGLPPRKGGDEIVNPYTTKDGSPTPSKETKPRPANQAIVSRVKHLAGVEAKRILDNAGKSNFLAWYDSFESSWSITITNAFKEAGLPDYMAQTWIADSRSRVMDATEANASEFPSVLSAALDQWPGRAEVFAVSFGE